MSLPVDWSMEVVREVRDARRRYAQENRAIARKFSAEVKAVEARIAASPHVSSPGALGTRFIVLRTYPYVIHFRIVAERIQILAVAHSRRHPDYWHSRIS